jgi:hypothetical protein
VASFLLFARRAAENHAIQSKIEIHSMMIDQFFRFRWEVFSLSPRELVLSNHATRELCGARIITQLHLTTKILHFWHEQRPGKPRSPRFLSLVTMSIEGHPKRTFILLAMNSKIITLVDAEISRLQQARTLLAQFGELTEPREHAPLRTKPKRKRRKLSPEGRARIVEALKRRWATQKSKPKGKRIA